MNKKKSKTKNNNYLAIDGNYKSDEAAPSIWYIVVFILISIPFIIFGLLFF